MIKKLTKKERKALREARNEWQVVILRSRKIGFEYVLRPADRGIYCFGSRIERDCLPTKGPAKAPIMRRLVPEPMPHSGPGDYFTPVSLIRKYASNYGCTGLANKSPRTKELQSSKTPGVGSYNLFDDVPPKKSARPFGIGAKVRQSKLNLNPGPGVYNFRKRKFDIEQAFGTRHYIKPAVHVFCGPANLAKCELCEEVPVGDYWHDFEKTQDMCRSCMEIEENKARYKIRAKVEKLKRLRELGNYKRARYCGFYHDHGNTWAAIKLLPKKQLFKKIRTENYLSSFQI